MKRVKMKLKIHLFFEKVLDNYAQGKIIFFESGKNLKAMNNY
jgi:hypothetical protein